MNKIGVLVHHDSITGTHTEEAKKDYVKVLQELNYNIRHVNTEALKKELHQNYNLII